jgi:GNAT superfamily N-acetyltransferase
LGRDAETNRRFGWEHILVSTQVADFDIVAFFGKRREAARLMRPGEVIPSSLEAAFDLLGQIDPDWVWVLDVDGTIKGVLVASPAHGVAVVWRVVVEPGASSMGLGKLLRAFLRTCRQRGIRGYLTMLSLSRETESRLAKILEHSGGKVVMENMAMMVSRMPRENI